MSLRYALATITCAAALSACEAGTGVQNGASTGTASTATSATPSASPSTQEPSPEPEPEEPEEEGVKDFAVGDVATVTRGEEDAAAITVTKAVKTKTPEHEQAYGGMPENGRFLVVTMTVENVGSDTFDVAPFDFYAVDAEGNHYGYAEGNSISAIDGKLLHGVTLNKGQKVTGRIAFDVPDATVSMVYAPAQTAVGRWTVK